MKSLYKFILIMLFYVSSAQAGKIELTHPILNDCMKLLGLKSEPLANKNETAPDKALELSLSIGRSVQLEKLSWSSNRRAASASLKRRNSVMDSIEGLALSNTTHISFKAIFEKPTQFFLTFVRNDGVRFRTVIDVPTSGFHHFRIPVENFEPDRAYTKANSRNEIYGGSRVERVLIYELPSNPMSYSNYMQNFVAIEIESGPHSTSANIHTELRDIDFTEPLIFETDLSSPALVETLVTFIGQSQNEPYERIKNVLLKLTQLLNDKKSQQQAYRIMENETTALKWLKQHGFEFYELNSKIEELDFFVIRQKEEKLKIPLENGEFAKTHGRWSHALQVLTILSGLDERDIETFRYIYQNMFVTGSIRTRQVAGWRLWNILFDAPGDHSPNAPAYWINKKHLILSGQ